MCKGRIEDGCFTGYKSAYEYEGEYVAGKRQGKGIEYCMSIHDVGGLPTKQDGQYVDVILKGGKYTIIEVSMRGVPKGNAAILIIEIG